LPGVRVDLQRVSDALRQSNISVTVLADRGATKGAVVKAFNEAATALTADDLFVFYFAGAGVAGKDGTVRWWLAGSESDALTASGINSLLDNIPTRRKVVIIDSCHAGAITSEDVLISR
jgi:bisphosphoglycerate-independent phosphoglycerate mutase (AlkP superfamily)